MLRWAQQQHLDGLTGKWAWRHPQSKATICKHVNLIDMLNVGTRHIMGTFQRGDEVSTGAEAIAAPQTPQMQSMMPPPTPKTTGKPAQPNTPKEEERKREQSPRTASPLKLPPPEASPKKLSPKLSPKALRRQQVTARKLQAGQTVHPKVLPKVVESFTVAKSQASAYHEAVKNLTSQLACISKDPMWSWAKGKEEEKLKEKQRQIDDLQLNLGMLRSLSNSKNVQSFMAVYRKPEEVSICEMMGLVTTLKDPVRKLIAVTQRLDRMHYANLDDAESSTLTNAKAPKKKKDAEGQKA